MNRNKGLWVGAPLVGAALGFGSIVSASAGSTPVATTSSAQVALSQASVARSYFYQHPSTSLTTSGNVPFTLGNAYWMHFGDAPASLSLDYAQPQAVYLLINTSWTDAGFAGQTVGTVRLSFSDGTANDTALVVGSNIREWECGVSWTANTLSSPSTVSVWQDQAQAAVGGAAATMDMLTIPVSSTARLTGVTVTATSNSHMGILFQGLTVTYNPLTRPGESDDTRAALRSQAPNHAQSQIFTGANPANHDAGTLKTNSHRQQGGQPDEDKLDGNSDRQHDAE